MREFESMLSNRKILITGHSGFTGSWLALWLHEIGASVTGVSLVPHTDPSLFSVLKLKDKMINYFFDIRNFKELDGLIQSTQPEIIIHLAAQSLVHDSYINPLDTISTNVMGTVNVILAAQNSASTKCVIAITSDKVYGSSIGKNIFDENSLIIGGVDPYSASKAASEFLINSLRNTGMSKNSPKILVARGGNIIGGGDWSRNRLIPDFIDAIVNSKELEIRDPSAVRPWQHVLCLVHGYLKLASYGIDSTRKATSFSWNFGPDSTDHWKVEEVIKRASLDWLTPVLVYNSKSTIIESPAIYLNSNLAKKHLNWNPPWSIEKSINETINWYKNYYENKTEMYKFSESQLNSYRKDISE